MAENICFLWEALYEVALAANKPMKKSLDEMTDEERWRLFPIILSPHMPEWKDNFLKEKTLLEQAIGNYHIVRLNHIGSTAILGLIAKPTIDILLEIKASANIEKLKLNMKSAGYLYNERPENPPPHLMFIKGYTQDGFKGQVFHVHVRYNGDWDEPYFRDYLLAHPDIAEEYARLKIELQKKYKNNRDAYTNAKSDFIKRITKLARKEITVKS